MCNKNTRGIMYVCCLFPSHYNCLNEFCVWALCFGEAHAGVQREKKHQPPSTQHKHDAVVRALSFVTRLLDRAGDRFCLCLFVWLYPCGGGPRRLSGGCRVVVNACVSHCVSVCAFLFIHKSAKSCGCRAVSLNHMKYY